MRIRDFPKIARSDYQSVGWSFSTTAKLAGKLVGIHEEALSSAANENEVFRYARIAAHNNIAARSSNDRPGNLLACRM